MKRFPLFIAVLLFAATALAWTAVAQSDAGTAPKTIAYIVSDQRIPFWDIMWRGVKGKAETLGYRPLVLSAENNAKRELENLAIAIRSKVAGVVVSPTNSSACVTILKLAERVGIPVVIADVGADAGHYVSYISSDNFDGAYQIGKILGQKLKSLGWEPDGRVGIIAIPQKRANGQARTSGFMKALAEDGIKGGGLRQQVTFSYQETYDFAKQLIAEEPNLRALWLQGSDRYQGALDAIADTGKDGEILLLTFDAEPEFLDLIPKGVVVGAGMQQPFLMGEKAVEALDAHLRGKAVAKEQKLPVLAISTENIEENMPVIKRNVLGLGAP